MCHQTPQFRNNTLANISNTNTVIEVVYEVINKIAICSRNLNLPAKRKEHCLLVVHKIFMFERRHKKPQNITTI